MRELAFSFLAGAASDIVAELLVIGWVAKWRPLEIFLYEWVPIRRRYNTLVRCGSSFSRNISRRAEAKLPKRDKASCPTGNQTMSELGSFATEQARTVSLLRSN